MFGTSDVWTGGITLVGRIQICCSAFLHNCKTIVLGKLNPKMHICCLAVEKDGPADLDTTSRSYPSRLRIRSTKNRTAKFSRPCDFARMAVFASTFTGLKNIKRGRDAPGLLKIPMPTLPTKSEAASNEAHRYNLQNQYAPTSAPTSLLESPVRPTLYKLAPRARKIIEGSMKINYHSRNIPHFKMYALC